MKVVIQEILAVVVIMTACVILSTVYINRHETGTERKPAGPVRPEVIVDGGESWPMFRGGQRLLGRASGTLSDSIQPIWKFKTNGPVKSSPAIVDGLVFIGSADANIYAIDLRDGSKKWAYKSGDAVEAAPCVVNGCVFVGSSDTYLYALDAKSGSVKWKYKTGSQILGAANWARSPDGQKTRILVGSYDSRLHCVAAENGQAVWIYQTGSFINGSPAVDEAKAVFGGCDAMIHVVALADGSRQAAIDTGSYIAASVAFFQGRAYVGNYDNVFICADLDSEQIVWKYTGGNSPFFSSPAVGEEVVVFGGRDKRIHCVSRSEGKPVWTFQTLGGVNSSPVICGDRVVVGSEDGRLYIINLSNGAKIWSFEIGQPITSSPAVVNGMIVVGCDDGYVYAFGPGQ